MEVPGLSTAQQQEGRNEVPIQINRWYLLKADFADWRNIGKKGSSLDVAFEVQRGVSKGGRFVEKFWLSPAALSRLHCFLSRAGYPKELIEKDEVDEGRVVGLQVWALLTEKPYNNVEQLCVDGWNFKAPSCEQSEEGAEPTGSDVPTRNYAKEEIRPSDDL